MGIPTTRTDRLTVTYDDGSGHPRTYGLACGHDQEADRQAAAAGDRTADACSHLDVIGGPVPAVPSGQACSMIYGGPQTATIRGMWRGHRVSEDYRRTNGCEVDRWSRMEPALPAPDPGEPETPPLRG
jgi:Ni/Co efflux regulator RcnB